jgi:deazaflavin-dependent oxidoreductase (nitroreductase family)
MMAAPNFLMKLSNGLIKVLLQSPLHKMISANIMLVTVTGRKSGKTYTTPVNYVQDRNIVYVTSRRERTWWRNMRHGAEAILRLRGQDFIAAGEVLEEEQSVAAQLVDYLSRVPHYARYFGVSLSSEDKINLEEAARAAKDRVFIIFRIKDET